METEDELYGYGHGRRAYGGGRGMGVHRQDHYGLHHQRPCRRREYELAETKEEKKAVLEKWLKEVTARSTARKAELEQKLKELE